MNLMWAPGQSDAAKELCRHLSGREKAALAALSLLFGVCAFAIPAVIMGSIMGPGTFPALPEGFAFPVVFGLVAVFWLIIALQRRLLLGTRFAKDRGLTMADIKATQPLSRRDYMILGGFAALAMAIAVIGAVLVAAQWRWL